MPTITRRGVTLTQAIQEAAAIASLGRVALVTYELWHPTMTEPIRIVNDTTPLTATLEGDAPRDGGETVLFDACPVDFKRPEESDSAESPSLELGRADVAGVIKAGVDRARGSLAPWQLIERVYVSDHLDAPAKLPPLTLELVKVEISGTSARVTAQYDDDFNIALPRITFSRREYPGLQR